jgi:hypothetical protein
MSLKEALSRVVEKTTAMSAIAFTSVIGCVVIAISDASLRPKFFEFAAANLGAFIALQRAGNAQDRDKQTPTKKGGHNATK